MFAFDLPPRAAMKVELPSGGYTMMIHLGGGKFVAETPPLMLYTVEDTADVSRRKLPIEWDSKALPDAVHMGFVTFDAEAAGKSLRDAAAAGDAKARAMVERLDALSSSMSADASAMVENAERPGVPALGEVKAVVAHKREAALGVETEGGSQD